MARIEISHLDKSYETFQALRDVSLDIADGEFVVLVGPSGCGKSTLLRTVAGLHDATSGTITFDGRPVNHLPPQERNVAMVFQNYALYPHMTVEQNIAFSLKIRGTPKREIAERVREAAELLGIEDYLHRRPRQLSGGQRQRVAMGRAMVRDANAFLFDEPLSNLDAKLRVQMRAEIRRLQKALKATAIYVTHDQVEAMTMGDRIVVMNGGRIEQVGRPLDIYREPANRFVAAFIGSPPMNFVAAHAEGTTAHTDDGQPIALPVSAKGRVSIGMRPEHLALDDQPSPDALKAAIVERQDLGSATSFQCAIGEARLEVQHQGIDPAHGSDVYVRVSRDHLYVFDENGNRVS